MKNRNCLPLQCSVVLAIVFFASTAAFGQAAKSSAPSLVTPAIEQRANAMLSKLTLDQKIELLGGVPGMATHAEPSIGLPSLRMSDGPMGVRTWGPSTAYAAGIGLAASWDTALAKRVGVALGQDARARGVSFLLGPGVNIYRAPMDGRNFEFFGEDPYLAGQVAVGYIDGVQSQGVIATIKHFAANNSEYDRHNADAIIGQRALREIYLPAFEAAVQQAHVGAIMDSYNLVNGEHSTQNKFLNVEVLRKDWGFRGIVMSDWGATYDGVAAANGGLDLEMPSGKFMNAKILLPAIKDGRVSVDTINAKVRHILETALRFGLVDRNQKELKIPLYDHQSNKIALESAEEGAVLLKNTGHLLPLDRNAIHSLAIVGPDAYPAVPGGGGSSHVDAFAPVSFLTGLSNSLYPGIKVYWNSGIQSPEEIFSETDWCADPQCKVKGLNRTEYLVSTGVEVASGIDTHVNTYDAAGEDIHSGYRRVDWVGYYLPKKSGEYRLVAAANPGEHFEVMFNGRQILETPGKTNLRGPKAATVDLEAGKAVKVEFHYWPTTTQKIAGLGMIEQDKLVNPDAVKLAKMADVAVVSVGFSPKTEGEGRDRSYQLPFGQVSLIQAIVAANPRTIVVLTGGGAVATERWLGQAPALLQTWYGGQQAGTALSKILFGEVDPSGKLPISWAKTLKENPSYPYYYEIPGTHKVKYGDGIFVGYRYYTTRGVKPLFPFGFGLSYTNFEFSNLSVTPQTASPDGPIQVSFEVKNTGKVAGAEVAEVYVSDPSATVERPKIELKGFRRVMLQPGETHHVSVELDKRSLAYWDTRTHGWKVDPGKFAVYVGDSSEHLPLEQSFTVR